MALGRQEPPFVAGRIVFERGEWQKEMDTHTRTSTHTLERLGI